MTLYIRRLGAMLFLALPLASVVLALTSIVRHSASDVADAFAGAAVLVYVWGGITASGVSLIHTLLTRRGLGGSMTSIVGGILLGIVGGALTPTLFTGFLLPSAILMGGLTGLIYALAVERLPALSASGQRTK